MERALLLNQVGQKSTVLLHLNNMFLIPLEPTQKSYYSCIECDRRGAITEKP